MNSILEYLKRTFGNAELTDLSQNQKRIIVSHSPFTLEFTFTRDQNTKRVFLELKLKHETEFAFKEQDEYERMLSRLNNTIKDAYEEVIKLMNVKGK